MEVNNYIVRSYRGVTTETNFVTKHDYSHVPNKIQTLLNNIKQSKINRLAMGHVSKVPLAIDKAHSVSQKALGCRPSVGQLNQVYGPNHPTPSV